MDKIEFKPNKSDAILIVSEVSEEMCKITTMINKDTSVALASIVNILAEIAQNYPEVMIEVSNDLSEKGVGEVVDSEDWTKNIAGNA